MSDQHSGLLINSDNYLGKALSLPSIEESFSHANSVHNKLKRSRRLHKTAIAHTLEGDIPEVAPRSRSQEEEKYSEMMDTVEPSYQVQKFSEGVPSFEFEDSSVTQAIEVVEINPIDFELSQQDKKNHLISQAMAVASEESHMAERVDSTKGRGVLKLAFASAVLAAVMTGGLAAYSNLSNISVEVASERAGISASVPDYRPSGYDLSGPVAYSEGEVTLNYSNGSVLGANFSLTQKATTERLSETLPLGYDTLNYGGLDIYLHDNGQTASWSDGQLDYTINSSGELSSEDISRIAGSL